MFNDRLTKGPATIGGARPPASLSGVCYFGGAGNLPAARLEVRHGDLAVIPVALGLIDLGHVAFRREHLARPIGPPSNGLERARTSGRRARNGVT